MFIRKNKKMRSKIIKFIYWIAVTIIIGLILSSCSHPQRLVNSYRQVLPTVVTVRGDKVDDKTNEICNVGTGFFITPKYVLTVAHVVKIIKEDTVELQLWNGDIVPAKKIAVNKFNDLALLQIDPNDIKSYEILLLDLWTNPQVGETIFVVGSPNAFDRTLSRGIFSRGTTKLDHPQWYWHCEIYLIDANIEGGSSGSPVFDIKHRIVGIVSGYYGNFTVIIPSYSIRAFLKEHNGY